MIKKIVSINENILLIIIDESINNLKNLDLNNVIVGNIKNKYANYMFSELIKDNQFIYIYSNNKRILNKISDIRIKKRLKYTGITLQFKFFDKDELILIDR